MATTVLTPSFVLGSKDEVLEQARKDANEKKRLAAQLRNEALAAIYDHFERHQDASNREIARWVKNHPATGPLVAHLNERSLADKIGKLRSR
jgi:hypothetical protein